MVPGTLAAALDEVIVATSALVVALSEAGGPREQRVAAQLAEALVALAAARASLGQARGEMPSPPTGRKSGMGDGRE
jgi:hypothetical protein